MPRWDGRLPSCAGELAVSRYPAACLLFEGRDHGRSHVGNPEGELAFAVETECVGKVVDRDLEDLRRTRKFLRSHAPGTALDSGNGLPIVEFEPSGELCLGEASCLADGLQPKRDPVLELGRHRPSI
jgi:hypothetical protein